MGRRSVTVEGCASEPGQSMSTTELHVADSFPYGRWHCKPTASPWAPHYGEWFDSKRHDKSQPTLPVKSWLLAEVKTPSTCQLQVSDIPPLAGWESTQNSFWQIEMVHCWCARRIGHISWVVRRDLSKRRNLKCFCKSFKLLVCSLNSRSKFKTFVWTDLLNTFLLKDLVFVGKLLILIQICVMEWRSNKLNAYKCIEKTAFRNVDKNESVGLDSYRFPAP